MRRVLLAIFALSLLVLASCLDPLVEDDVQRVDAILPPGASVPSVAESAAVVAMIEDNDYVDGNVVELQSGFLDGEPVSFWDMGPATVQTQPLYLLAERKSGGGLALPEGEFEPVGHPPIWNVVPGDPAYSPFWLVLVLPVTDQYQGEVLPSFQAVEQAIESGLVEPPIKTEVVINCPVVAPGVRWESEKGVMSDTSPAYYKGWLIDYIDFGVVDLAGPERVPVGQVFTLRRQGEEPLNEPLRQVDLTGDGETRDTNDIFRLPDDGNTHLFNRVEIVVPSDYQSIDGPDQQLPPDFTAASDFLNADGEPLPDSIVARYPDDEFCNCPYQRP